MRRITLRIAGSMFAIMLSGGFTLEARAADLSQPESVNQTAFDSDNYLYFAPQGNGVSASPSDKPQTPPATPAPTAQPPAKAEPVEVAEGTEEACKSRWCRCGELGDPWKLPQPCFLQERGITVGGWMEAGVYANTHGAEFNGPLGLENLTSFNVNQLWIFAEKKAKSEDGDVDIGGRVDYVFGTDGPDTQAFGDQTWDFGWNSSRDYGSAIPQMYLDVAFGDWTVRGGRFLTPHGYETVPAVNNFFFSHSYTFYYGEPFTHTGLTATYKFNDKLSAFAGYVDGWDSGFDNLNRQDQFLGGINWTISDKATLAWSVLAGKFGVPMLQDVGGVNLNPIGDRVFSSLVFTYKITDKWTYVLQNDVGVNTGVTPLDVHQEWYGVNQYLLYKLSDCSAFGGRFEWFRDDDGSRVIPGFPPQLSLVPGNAGNYYEATVGFNYKPHANVLFRPELRWDWYDGTTVAGRPFNNGRSDSQLSAGFDMIVTF